MSRSQIVATASAVAFSIGLAVLHPNPSREPTPRKVPAVTCAPADTPAKYASLLGTVKGDGNFSASMGTTRAAWVTGDNVDAHGAFAHNSLRIVTDRCKVVTFSPAVPNASDGSHWWLGPTVYDSQSGKLYSFGSHVTVTGSGQWTSHGTDIIQFNSVGSFEGVLRSPSTGVPDEEGNTQWGAGLYSTGSMLYVYGAVNMHNEDFGFGRRVKLARVSLSQIGDWEQWEYWTGSTWSLHEADAVLILGAQDGNTDTAFSVVQPPAGSGGGFRIYTKKGGSFGDAIGYFSGPQLWGPWTWHTVRASTGIGEYLPAAHPEAPLTPTGLLVTVSQTNAGPSFEEWSW